MTELGEIFFRKNKKGWTAYDRDGNSVEGMTKEHAKNNYLLVYGELLNQNNLGFDMTKVDKTL